MMKSFHLAVVALVVLMVSTSSALADSRQLIQLPDIMQRHMMKNMRDHLRAINEILAHMSDDKLDAAADIAESRLGMSSLTVHQAKHLGQFMPADMQHLGSNMHRAASRFARTAQEGDLLPAVKMLSEVTSACVACHQHFRIR